MDFSYCIWMGWTTGFDAEMNELWEVRVSEEKQKGQFPHISSVNYSLFLRKCLFGQNVGRENNKKWTQVIRFMYWVINKNKKLSK